MNTQIFSKNSNLTLMTTALGALLFLTITNQTHALSCLNPSEMIDDYATNEKYTIALVEAGEIETEGAEHDQTVTVKTVYKGELEEQSIVSFNHDETWQYLCVGAPAEMGEEVIYILYENSVSQIFTPDSELGNKLLSSLDNEPTTPIQVTTEEVEKKSLMQQIIGLLQQIISLFGGTSENIVEETEQTKSYIGMTTIEAAAYADSKDILFRVVEIDGEPQATTKDYREGRINAVVEKDIVTSYTVEGLETQPVEGPATEEVADTHEAIIGMTLTEARVYAEANDVMFRLGMIDGEPQAVTMDYRPGRITAEVEDDIITSYTTE